MPIWLSFCISAACIIGAGILSTLIGEKIPRSVFHTDRFPFRSHRWEKDGKVWEKVGVKRWKDHVPDMSRVRKKKMVSKHLGKCPTADGVHTLAVETCRAEAIHAILCVLSIGLIFLWSNRWIGVALSALYTFCNLPFIIIQRYNRPALLALEQRLRVREERKARLNRAEEEVEPIDENSGFVR